MMFILILVKKLIYHKCVSRRMLTLDLQIFYIAQVYSIIKQTTEFNLIFLLKIFVSVMIMI